MKRITTALAIAATLVLMQARAGIPADEQAVISAMCKSITNLAKNGGYDWNKACVGITIGDQTGEVIPEGVEIGVRNGTHGTAKYITTMNFSPSTRLSGRLPQEIGNLTQLEVLSLRLSKLSGALPSSINRLSWLRSLDLTLSKFEGKLPSMIKMNRLEHLNLDRNQFTGTVAAQLDHGLAKLKTINFFSNRFYGNLPSFYGSGDLEKIQLQLNQFSGSIPTHWARLNEIQHIDVSGNNLSGEIPVNLPKRRKLKTLILSNNKLSGDITSLSFRSLETLDLRNNQFTGGFPSSIKGLQSPKTINVANNKLSNNSFPISGNWIELTKLDVSNNQMSGVVPRVTARLPKLNTLYFNNNKFGGVVPDFSGSKVCRLSMERNNLTFEDILPHHSSNSNHFNNRCGNSSKYQFTPQNAIDKARAGFVGEPITVDYRDHSNDRIQWYRGSPGAGVALGNQNGLSYTPILQGEYYYTVKNPQLTELELTSHSIDVGYKVGGNISGLCKLVVCNDPFYLMLNGTEVIEVKENGAFSFTTPLSNSDRFEVTIKHQPTNATCNVINGSGTMSSAHINNIRVVCSTSQLARSAIGGKATGLCDGQVCVLNPVTLNLQSWYGFATNNEIIEVNFNGKFTFKTKFTPSQNNPVSYEVTIKKQPKGAKCSVQNAEGTMLFGGVNDILVTCTDGYTVGGEALGLPGCQSVRCQANPLVLQLNGKETVEVKFNGKFTFKTELAQGKRYSVTVKKEPTGYACRVDNKTGTVGAANVNNVKVMCQEKPKLGRIFSDSFEKP